MSFTVHFPEKNASIYQELLPAISIIVAHLRNNLLGNFLKLTKKDIIT